MIGKEFGWKMRACLLTPFVTVIVLSVGLIIYGWIDNSLFHPNTEFCKNLVWLLVRIAAIFISILTLVLGLILAMKVK